MNIQVLAAFRTSFEINAVV